jgi:hypothetical protein
VFAADFLVVSRTWSMGHRSESIQKWWPTTQSLDLVEGPLDAVATAVETEVRRFLGGEAVVAAWESFADLDAAFRAAAEFANVPTFYLVLPSRSRWTVLWNNSFLCDGYDSLCWCLTQNHGLTTVHWSAHDEWTTFQSGASFHYRRMEGATMLERSVSASQEDKRWIFFEDGTPLPEEDLAAYGAKRKRDRFNETLMSRLLLRLGASPWSEDFYALPEQPSFVVRRPRPPASVLRRSRSEVVRAG